MNVTWVVFCLDLFAAFQFLELDGVYDCCFWLRTGVLWVGLLVFWICVWAYMNWFVVALLDLQVSFLLVLHGVCDCDCWLVGLGFGALVKFG